jgi:hypothetical protein
MSTVTREGFADWLERYGQAWRTGDPAAAGDLFSPDARYEENPFDEPMIGREAIIRYWDEGAGKAQKDVAFAFEILSVQDDSGVAHWRASFVRVPSGASVDLDGLLVARFSPEGVCYRFREWWHRREIGGENAQA